MSVEVLEPICAYCGQTNSHSKRCSVTKGLADPMDIPDALTTEGIDIEILHAEVVKSGSTPYIHAEFIPDQIMPEAGRYRLVPVTPTQADSAERGEAARNRPLSEAQKEVAQAYIDDLDADDSVDGEAAGGRQISPEDARQLALDQALYGLSVVGTQGERIDPRDIEFVPCDAAAKQEPTDSVDVEVPAGSTKDLIEAAWGLIANANGGEWDGEWGEAAIRWRDRFHAWRDNPTPQSPDPDVEVPGPYFAVDDTVHLTDPSYDPMYPRTVGNEGDTEAETWANELNKAFAANNPTPNQQALDAVVEAIDDLMAEWINEDGNVIGLEMESAELIPLFRAMLRYRETTNPAALNTLKGEGRDGDTRA